MFHKNIIAFQMHSKYYTKEIELNLLLLQEIKIYLTFPWIRWEIFYFKIPSLMLAFFLNNFLLICVA